MGDLRASVLVVEDVALDEHILVSESGEPKGWVYLGESQDVALWGSPASLRRVAAALVLLAERADGMRVLRYVATCNVDGLRGEAGARAVNGS